MINSEIYPKIVVYNNVFEDPEKMYSILKQSGKSENELFEKWKQWYTFGEKIEDTGLTYDKTVDYYKIINDLVPQNESQKDQKYFMDELIRGFHAVNNDYLNKFGFKMDLTEKSNPIEVSTNPNWHTTFPSIVEKYKWQGPSICKYFPESGSLKDLVMQFHSDHIIEEFVSPGYKFILTTTTYFNDDYEGGEVVFAVGDNTITYEPKMGDFVIFPSGHPDYFTENNNPYFHAVKKIHGKEKYFSRMYWTTFAEGSEEFFKTRDSLDELERKQRHKDYSYGVYQGIQKKYEPLSGLEEK